MTFERANRRRSSMGFPKGRPVGTAHGLRLAGVLACAAVALGAAGCTSVRAWERGTLSTPAMDPEAPDRAVAASFAHHVFDAREGATGGASQAGGGCGCN